MRWFCREAFPLPTGALARVLTRGLAGVLLVLCTGGRAQVPAAAAPPAPAGAPAAFVLDIQAPPDIAELLRRHLDLVRFQDMTDLSDSELARLATGAQRNARDLVATLGYFSPRIEVQTSTPAGDGLRRLSLQVDPGPATRVTDVRLEFAGAIRDEPAAQAQRQAIVAAWSLRPGDRYTQAGWDAAKLQALRQLTERRYPLGRIADSLADIDADAGSATLALTLDSGPAFRLGALRVDGLRHHDAALVDRLARLDGGDDYALLALSRAQQRLGDSGYFDSAFVSIDTRGDPQAAEVSVQVREAPLQKLVLGVGASTDGGARVSAEHTHHRIPGLGWRAVSRLSLDRATRSLGTELTAPPDPDRWRWTAAGQVQASSDADSTVYSQLLRVGRNQSGDRIDRNLYLQYDRADTLPSGGGETVVAQALSANYAFSVRNFDNLPFPTSGWGLGLEVGGGSTLGVERKPYTRLVTRGLAIVGLGEGRGAGQLALRGEAGAVLAEPDALLPSTQLFLTGGDNTVRGYGLRSIGVQRADGQLDAGRYLLAGSVEWQHPLQRPGMTDWDATLFVDAGAVADTPADLSAQVGVGAGLRWRSPIGPLQIDLAYGVAVQRWRLHLTVGFNF